MFLVYLELHLFFTTTLVGGIVPLTCMGVWVVACGLITKLYLTIPKNKKKKRTKPFWTMVTFNGHLSNGYGQKDLNPSNM